MLMRNGEGKNKNLSKNLREDRDISDYSTSQIDSHLSWFTCSRNWSQVDGRGPEPFVTIA
jgi:hypothetical protein